ncbi:integrase, catalytic region, zinc finger, CCHC-type containing protein [Tanacetum coccineum]
MINSQIDDMIKEQLSLKQQIDSLEQNFLNQIKEKESLLQTFIVFKNESKEKESKYMDKKNDLEKKIKELDNIVYKVDQSAQTVHMLIKPQVFYDNAHKQALGYQNLFYLKKAQRIKPTLYDGSVISSQHADSPVIDDEETLILEELNRLSKDFGKRFVPQQELSDAQAFWLQTSHHNTDQSASLPIQIEVPKELPKTNSVTKFIRKNFFLKMIDSYKKIMSQDVMICVMNSTTVFDDVNLEMQSSESCVKCLHLDAELLNKQNAYNDLSKSYSQLEKHCISLELTMQLNQEIFQKDSLSNNQNALEILEYFENNDLKAQLQAKDTTICKLKEHIKSMRENDKEEKVKHEMDEIETINIELEHSVAKLLYENERLHKEIEHLKKIYKDQFDSIKKTRAFSKERDDSLIAQLNSKSMENADLKCQIQDKVFVITSLKNNVRKLKGKENIENAAQIPIATTIAPGMFKIDLDHLAPRLLKNREAHIEYLKHTQEQADILRGIVEQAKAKQSLDNALDFACKHDKRIQELLVYVRDTCPNAYKPSEKLIAATPMNKVKKVRFSEPLTSSSNIQQMFHLLLPVSMTGYLDYSLVSGLRMLKTYDREPLSAHELRSRDTNLYTISLDDMLKTSSICLLSKASKTKSWLWHRRLSHLNFGTLNKLAKDGLARGIPKLKFQKDHLCLVCALGKSKKSSHQPKAEDTNQEKLYLLHMDLCGSMRVESINEKKYILVIVDDYSRFT